MDWYLNRQQHGLKKCLRSVVAVTKRLCVFFFNLDVVSAENGNYSVMNNYENIFLPACNNYNILVYNYNNCNPTICII